MQALLSNLPLAARRLLRARAFSLTAVATLALAIGANVAIFGLVETLFFAPLPVREPERLVGIYESRDGVGFHPLSYPDFLTYREESETLEGLAATYLGAPLEVRIGDQTSHLQGAVVSADLFPLLGLETVAGRFFGEDEDSAPNRGAVAVISETLWQERYGGRREAIGASLSLNDTPFTIVGVAPEEARSSLRLGSAIDVWIPTSTASVGYRWCDALDPDCTWMSLIGRLAPAASIEDARSELAVLAAGLRSEEPSARERERGVAVAPLRALHPGEWSDSIRRAGTLLFAVSLLLVVAGASLSGLLIARGLARRREVAVRLSMGASRSEVVSLFLAETLLIGLAGGVLGLVAATSFGRLLSRFFAGREPLELALGPQTLLYAVLLSIVTGVAVGLVPGLQASQPHLARTLRGSVGGSGARPKALAGLVVIQTALALVLVFGTGLVAKSIDGLRRTGATEPDRIATLRLRPRLVGLDPVRAQALTHDAVRRLENLPGVRSVALSTHFTPGRGRFVPVAAAPLPDRTVEASTQPVSPRFFETVGVPLLRGRDFDDRDRSTSEPVAVVNRTLAATLWPGGSGHMAIDRSILISPGSPGEERRLRVVGVVDDAAIHLDPVDAPVPQLYLAYWQDPELVDARLMIATTMPAGRMLPTLRAEVAAVDRGGLPVTETEVLSARLRRLFTPTWLAGEVLGLTGALALLLCGLCLHGALGLVVTQRRREIGIRMAIGATRSEIVSLVVRDALTMAGAGLGLGLALSLGLGRLLESHLFQVSPTDPSAIFGAVLVLGAVATVAAWWPARGASRVDPVVALRAE